MIIDDDEEIDSDEAMGESDTEKYAPGLFKGTKESVDSRLAKERDTKNQISMLRTSMVWNSCPVVFTARVLEKKKQCFE